MTKKVREELNNDTSTSEESNIQNEIDEEIKAHDKKISEGISKDDLEVFFKVMKQIRKNLGG